jgi:hypothetical protein
MAILANDYAGAALWVGESGILPALTLVVAAVIVSRGRWTIIRSLPERKQPQVAASVGP